MTRVIVRGFIRGYLQFEQEVDGDVVDMENLATIHTRKLLALPGGEKGHMIEIEFPDEPDESTRFFRFGTESVGMVKPIEINLDEEPEN